METSWDSDTSLTPAIASPEQGISHGARMMTLREVAGGRLDLVAAKMEVMPHEELKEIGDELCVILEGLERGCHVDEFMYLQKLVQGRVDLTPGMLEMAHHRQLEFFAAIKTGSKEFLSPILADIPPSYVTDVLFDWRCRNIKCFAPLPAYGCECNMCASKKGFCSDCMCMVCNKLHPQSDSCSWVRCDICNHWAHMDCAIHGEQIKAEQRIANGTGNVKMLFRCQACLWTSELLGRVRKIFQERVPLWNRDALLRELGYVCEVFHQSEDSEERKFFTKCAELLGSLDSGSDESICRMMLLQALQEMGDEKNNHEALERVLIDTSAAPIELSYKLLKYITSNFSKQIGSGGFGTVYLGVFRNKKIAVKKLNQTERFSEEQFQQELACLRRVKHENIVRFLGYCSDTKQMAVEYKGQYVVADYRRRFLCFEYIPNKSLHDFLKDESHGNKLDTCYQLFKGICKGLRYLHNIERINHLDLKPENILLDGNMVPKITDFGLSRRFSGEKSRIITENIRGSPAYMAPEHLRKGEISFKSDIFSLGILMRKLLCGSTVSSDFEDWLQSLNIVSPQVKLCIEVAQLCGDDDPRKRPTIDYIIDMLNEKETVTEMTSTGFVHSRNNSFIGTGMLGIRYWLQQNFTSSGYSTGKRKRED